LPEELDSLLRKLAGIDTKQTIMIMCSGQSKHEDLVRVLDLCAKSGLGEFVGHQHELR
jgi:biopolymer transport protein ExbD